MQRARSKAAEAARARAAENPETTTTTSQPSGVTTETKTQSVIMVSEMQDTLNKINTLLADLQTRGTRTTKPSTTTDNTTITSCLDSISRDISTLSSQIPAPCTTRKPEPSTDSAVTIATSLPHDDDHDETDNASKQPTDKRTRKLTGKSTTSSSNFYRGSDASQAYSLHRSSFDSIAALSGFGEVTTLRQRRNSVATDTAVTTTSGAQYFTEYPPQRGSQRFNGVFADDIQALFDDSARGLITL